MMVEINEKNFEDEVIKKSEKVPVLVDFYADWCFPCKVLSPILEKISEDLEGKMILAKINVDEAPSLAEKYQIMSVPNVKLFKNGKIVDEFIGALPEQEIRYWLKKSGIG
ncbi:MAG: thioredoxin [Candidatus Aenigmatarchaeota archaeon]